MSNKLHAMKDAAKHTRTPKLRFPEFRDAEGWEKTKLQKLARPVSERAINGDGDKVLSLSGEHGIVLQSDYFGKKVAGDNAERYIKIARNDFVYNDRTTKQSIYGTIKRLSKYEDGIVSPIYKCFRFNSEEKPVFWEWYFESGVHDSELSRLVNEGARAGRFNISIDKFLSTNVFHPNIAEQQKLAECLTSLDELTSAHGQKLGALKSYKKGLMRQLLPDRGEAVPRLRFPEFRHQGAWEESKAGNVFKNRLDRGEEGLPIYSVTIHDGMVRRDSLDRNYYDIEEASGNKKACKNDIAYNMMRMWQGALGVAPEDCMVSPAYIVLIPQKHAVSRFFEYLFKLPSSLELLTSYSRGLTKDRLRLYYDDFAGIPLRYPNDPEEQHRIADCLSTLDEQITAQSRKLEVLKQYKQTLLRQLFPSPGEAES